jgi:hypothetical protein
MTASGTSTATPIAGPGGGGCRQSAVAAAVHAELPTAGAAARRRAALDSHQCRSAGQQVLPCVGGADKRSRHTSADRAASTIVQPWLGERRGGADDRRATHAGRRNPAMTAPAASASAGRPATAATPTIAPDAPSMRSPLADDVSPGRRVGRHRQPRRRGSPHRWHLAGTMTEARHDRGVIAEPAAWRRGTPGVRQRSTPCRGEGGRRPRPRRGPADGRRSPGG